MPKVPKFEVKKTARGWKLNVPASLSDTGKKQELYFPSRDKATDRAQELRASYRAHGEASSVLPPRLADDALRAWRILEPLGVSLSEAARHFASQRDEHARSVPLAEAVAAWKVHTEARLRPHTLTAYRQMLSRLTPFSERVLASITAAEIAEALAGASFQTYRRGASAFWHWCAAAPRKWCKPEVFEDVPTVTTRNDHDVGTLTPEQCARLLRTAEEHQPETVPVYAVALFGGVRMEEALRLTGDEFTADGIEIGAKIAKKRRRRHVPMNDTLAAWLEVYPFAPCPNWKRKHDAVRRLAGWRVWSELLADRLDLPAAGDGRWPKNALRHTNASAEIASGATLEDLLFRFGHTGSAETLRAHYVGRYTKKDAIAFWSIGPRGKAIDLLRTA